MTIQYQFFNPETNEYPLFPGDMMLIDPNWQIGDTPPAPWVEVQESERPENTDESKVVAELLPSFVDGKWVRTFEIRSV
jgi:hypothetical protein